MGGVGGRREYPHASYPIDEKRTVVEEGLALFGGLPREEKLHAAGDAEHSEQADLYVRMFCGMMRHSIGEIAEC